MSFAEEIMGNYWVHPNYQGVREYRCSLHYSCHYWHYKHPFTNCSLFFSSGENLAPNSAVGAGWGT